jgi:hypothetical protein
VRSTFWRRETPFISEAFKPLSIEPVTAKWYTSLMKKTASERLVANY